MASSTSNNLNVSGYGKLYTVVKEFNARLGDELNIKPGDTVELISDDSEYDDGWFMGKNLSTNKVGLYPKVFTKVIADSQNPSLLRSRSRRLTPQGSPVTQTPPIQFPSVAEEKTKTRQNQNYQNLQNSHTNSHLPRSDHINNNSSNNNRNLNNNNNLKIMNNNHTHSHNNNNHHHPPFPHAVSDKSINAAANSTIISQNSANSNSDYSTVNRALTDIDNALKELDYDQDNTTTSTELSQSTNTSNTNLTDIPLEPSEVESWTPEQVTQYFSFLNFDIESAGKFARHKISGSILIQLELSYLKELDIASFGTRFEMYKEIEELRLAARNKSFKKEMNPQPRHSRQEMRESLYGGGGLRQSVHKHARKRSQSLDDLSGLQGLAISSKSPAERNHKLMRNSMRPVSVLPQPPKLNSDYASESGSSEDDSPNPPMGLFESPRKAPQPPDFPSPIANQEFKFGGGPSDFVAPQFRKPNAGHNRQSSNSSSVYAEVKHSRTTSSLSFTPSNPSRIHTRNPSESNKFFNGNTPSIDQVTSPTPDGVPASNNNKEATYKRYSSLFSSGAATERENVYDKASPVRPTFKQEPRQFSGGDQSPIKIDHSKKKSLTSPQLTSPTSFTSPERRSMSAKELGSAPKPVVDTKRAVSSVPSSTSKSTPTASTPSTLRSLTTRRKNQTSAFQEGIRTVSTDEAIKTADYSGWMSKRGNLSIGTWKQRYFTLHKTRLSYFTSLKDKREKGLIDITSHRVLPATEVEDKLSAVYAATTGSGSYCFKLVPPAPGSRKGLTFTQQKVHYFAVETREEMRSWMSALMRATIEMDESVPVISSCVTPTVPLQKAQEMMQVARENARVNLEKIQAQQGQGQQNPYQIQLNDSATEEEDSLSSEVYNSTGANTSAPFTQTGTSTPSSNNSTTFKNSGVLSSNKDGSGNGMSTPYLMTQGLNANGTLDPRKVTIKRTPTSTNPVPMITKLDELESTPETDSYDTSTPGQNHSSTPSSQSHGKNTLSVMSNGSLKHLSGPTSPGLENSQSGPPHAASTTSLSAAVGAVGRRVMSLRKGSNKD